MADAILGEVVAGNDPISEGRVLSRRSDSKGKPQGFSSYIDNGFVDVADEEDELAHGLPMSGGGANRAKSLSFSSLSAIVSLSFDPGAMKSFATPAYASWTTESAAEAFDENLPHIDLTPSEDRNSGCLPRVQMGEPGRDAGTELDIVATRGLELIGSGVLLNVCRVRLRSGKDEVRSRRPLAKLVELLGGGIADKGRCEGSEVTDNAGVFRDISGVIDL